MVRFGVAIFLSAFLLFQVQPLMGKYSLPWFGGGPAFWTTCLLFSQVFLLMGYAYAHLGSSILTPRMLAAFHLVLLASSLLLLPIAPSSDLLEPGPEDAPTRQILTLLVLTVGPAYFLLSSTGPLIQRWFSSSFPGRSPYRLYALSNTSSLLALLSYPLPCGTPAHARKSGCRVVVGLPCIRCLFRLECGASGSMAEYRT